MKTETVSVCLCRRAKLERELRAKTDERERKDYKIVLVERWEGMLAS